MSKTRPRRVFPNREQLQELPVQLEYVVPPEWEDDNGHVNIQYYLRLFELGGWIVLEEFGVDRDWLQANSYSFFDLEHHLNYLAEMHVGDRVTTYNRIVGKSDKRFHGMFYIYNESRERLACTLEYVSNGVDMTLRRTAPMPDQLSHGLDALYAKHQQLSWPAELCGIIVP